MYTPPQPGASKSGNAALRNSRIQAFDYLKLSAIFLVLWGHCVQWLISSDPSSEFAYRLIYSFHMPLFMMIAGYFSVSSLSLDFNNFVKKKALQLIVPFIVWASLILIFQIVECNNIGVIRLIKDAYILNFWFLKCLFVCFLLEFFSLRILGKYVDKWIALIIGIVLSQLITSHQVAYMFPAFCVGYAVRTFAAYNENRVKIVTSAITGSLWLSLFCFIEFDIIPTFQVTKILMGLCGSLCLFELFLLIFRKPSSSRIATYFSHCGGMTLGIYIIQSIILEKIMASQLNFDNQNPFLFNLIIVPVLSIIVLIISIAFVYTIRKSLILSRFLLGEQWKNT